MCVQIQANGTQPIISFANYRQCRKFNRRQDDRVRANSKNGSPDASLEATCDKIYDLMVTSQLYYRPWNMTDTTQDKHLYLHNIIDFKISTYVYILHNKKYQKGI